MSDAAIDAFLAGRPHAVVGASRSRAKYGNKVLRCYLQASRPVYAVNPNCEVGARVEGLPVFDTLGDLPERVHGISIITPPGVTEKIARDAIAAGVRHVWMQPGAESTTAVERLRRAGVSVVFGGPCLLVVLGFRDSVAS